MFVYNDTNATLLDTNKGKAVSTLSFMYEQCSMALNPVTHHDDLSQISPVATLGTISSCRKVSENCPSFEDVWHKGKISVFNYSVCARVLKMQTISKLRGSDLRFVFKSHLY